MPRRSRHSTSPLAVATICVLVLAGCQPGPSGSINPSAMVGASASALPSSAPSAADFPAVDLPPYRLVRLGDGLPMYDVPGQPPIDSFSAATDAVVVGGPRDVNDGTWYQVLFPPHDEVMRLAWVRVADLTDIAPIDGLCPTSPDALIGLLPWDRLRCFSETPVTVTGEVGHCQGGVVEGEPEWLAYACWEVTAGEGGPLGLHAAPESGIVFPEHRVRARITGHFDDPASPTCRPRHDALNPAWEAPSPGEQVYLCREAFVVDTFEILEDLGPQEG